MTPKAQFTDVVRDVSGGNFKVPQSAFQESGNLAVIDQGRGFVAGYTDDMAYEFQSASLPVIVFGDHTKAVKYIDFPFAMGADGVKVLKPSAQCDAKYLYHYLRYAKIPDAGYSRHYKFLKELQIPLPALVEQCRIAAILDKADALRAKRSEAVTKLDQLLQSVFIDMFGDPVDNPKKWRAVECAALCESSDDIKCGPFGTQLLQSEYREKGVPLWGIRHVNRDFLVPTVEFLSEEKAEELSAYSIVSGDLVMTRKGTVGKCAIYPSGQSDGIMHSDLLRFRIDSAICNPVFLRDQFRYSPVVSRQVETMSPGAIMAGINVSKLKRLEVLLPGIDLQNKYAEVVEQRIGGLSRSFRRSQEGLEHTFASLQQKAFSGAL